jgi:hypothetical protein
VHLAGRGGGGEVKGRMSGWVAECVGLRVYNGVPGHPATGPPPPTRI